MNEDRFIVPGLGDYGDRYYGTQQHIWLCCLVMIFPTFNSYLSYDFIPLSLRDTCIYSQLNTLIRQMSAYYLLFNHMWFWFQNCRRIIKILQNCGIRISKEKSIYCVSSFYWCLIENCQLIRWKKPWKLFIHEKIPKYLPLFFKHFLEIKYEDHNMMNSNSIKNSYCENMNAILDFFDKIA